MRERPSREMVEVSHLLAQRGWVANHDGNITCKLGPNRFLATPTATSKRSISSENLIEIDEKCQRIAGRGRPFSEATLHMEVYRERPDVNAVVHAHPPYATALACSGRNLVERPFLPEAVVSLGDRIPLVPYAMPGGAASAALAPFVKTVDAVLLENHGALAWGADIEQAFLRLELLEHLAHIATLAQTTGGVRPLPQEHMATLLTARAQAGLGQAADQAGSAHSGPTSGAKQAGVVACAPAPHASVKVQAPGAMAPSELLQIIREELQKVLRK